MRAVMVCRLAWALSLLAASLVAAAAPQITTDFLPFGFMTHAVPDVAIDEGANTSILATTSREAVWGGFSLVLPYLSVSSNRTAEDRRNIVRYLDRCHSVGVRVLYDLTRLVGYSAGRLPPLELLATEVHAVRNHPAIVGWYLADEPDGNGMPLNRLLAARRMVMSLSALPMAICLDTAGPTGSSAWEQYINLTDIVLADPYPVPNRGLWFVADTAEKLSRLNKPYWVVPQLADEKQRSPSTSELAVMVYISFIHGASGAVFFKEDGSAPGLDRAPTSSLLMNAASTMAFQLAEIGPALTSVTTPRLAVGCSNRMVHASARVGPSDGNLLILAASTLNDLTTNTFSLAKADVLFATRASPTVECVQLFTFGERCNVTQQIECPSALRSVAAKLLPDGTLQLQDTLEALATRVYRCTTSPSKVDVPVSTIGGDRGSVTVPLANNGFEKSTNAGTADSWFVTMGRDEDASAMLDHYTYLPCSAEETQNGSQGMNYGGAAMVLPASLRLTTPSLLGASSWPADPSGGSAVRVHAIWCDGQQWCATQGSRGNPCQCRLSAGRHTISAWARAPKANEWSIRANNGSNHQRLQLDFGEYGTTTYGCVIESPPSGIHAVPPSAGWALYTTVGTCSKTIPAGISVASLSLRSVGQVWVDNVTLTSKAYYR